MIPALLPVAAVRGPIRNLFGTVIADNNMLVQPTDFNGLNIHAPNGLTGAWGKVRSSITAPGGTRPDGSAVQKLVEDGTTNTHYLQAFVDGGGSTLFDPNHVVWRWAFLAKPVERTRCVAFFDINNGAVPGTAISVGFDLAGVQVFDTTITGDPNNHWTVIGTSITPAIGGYVLCIIDGLYTGAGITPSNQFFGFYSPYIVLDNGSGMAARSITYAGNGTSGILLWWQSLMPKGAWLLNRLHFLDDFNDSSTIDFNDTRASGFNWYTHNLFPNSDITSFGFVTAPPSFPTPAANISVANSKVTLTGTVADSQPGWMSQLWTVAYTGDLGGGPQGYRGFTYQLPAFVEGNFGYDATTFDANVIFLAGTVALWGFSVEGLIGGQVGPFIEMDVAEAGAVGGAGNPSFGATNHSWTAPAGTPHLQKSVGGVGFSGLINPTVNEASLANMHRYCRLLLDPASNDGTYGVTMAFWDGNYVGMTAWSPSFGTEDQNNPAGTPGTPSGAYTQLGTQHFPVFMNTCATVVGHVPFAAVPMTVDWIKVFTAPA